MLKKSKIILLFYSKFWLFTQGASVAACSISYHKTYGFLWALSYFFYLKILFYGITWYLISQLSASQFTFYQNLTLSIRRLFVLAFAIDFILFFTSLFLLQWLQDTF